MVFEYLYHIVMIKDLELLATLILNIKWCAFVFYRYSAEEVEVKVSTFRKMLMSKEGVPERAIERDEYGKPM